MVLQCFSAYNSSPKPWIWRQSGRLTGWGPEPGHSHRQPWPWESWAGRVSLKGLSACQPGIYRFHCVIDCWPNEQAVNIHPGKSSWPSL